MDFDYLTGGSSKAKDKTWQQGTWDVATFGDPDRLSPIREQRQPQKSRVATQIAGSDDPHLLLVLNEKINVSMSPSSCDDKSIFACLQKDEKK
ncbi:hypothetical protein DCAR_0625378 [Daucus carota subsp. sativus]|uniref:Uncharacterized protein n=1 Tax=Daucus carota subsp. sativus TaxID=79200 RepID=A0A164WEN4_DAUCS|nr:hypothetical protein DCAR_0625378 [Daucus carota subsp. sativus]